MNTNKTMIHLKYTLFSLSMFFQILPIGCVDSAPQMQLTEQTDNFEGTVEFFTEELTTFVLDGSEPTIGDYTATGEVLFKPGADPGTLVGDGVAIFENPDGDQLVAVVTWTVGAEKNGERDSDIRFSWRDSVEFSDGTTAASTGKFADPDDRPPGLVVIAIIAVLIGMLLPAVQKVR